VSDEHIKQMTKKVHPALGRSIWPRTIVYVLGCPLVISALRNASDYLTKPIKRSEIIDVVRRLQNQNNRRALVLEDDINAQTLMAAGCDGYDTKPVDFKRLLGKIHGLMEN
jgi:DNA-binding response OmpR family regulator